jgi:hypothetical protein
MIIRLLIKIFSLRYKLKSDRISLSSNILPLTTNVKLSFIVRYFAAERFRISDQ